MSDRLIDQGSDVFVSELSRIDSLGANQRLLFSLPTIDSDGYKSVQVKLIVPTHYMITLATLILGQARGERDSVLARFAFGPGTAAN